MQQEIQQAPAEDATTNSFAEFLSLASFWFPDRLIGSAWLEHAPFAFWLVDAIRPRTFVELGTHSGFSYSAFCQAIASLNVGTRCHAIDTWCGDEHAGFYDEEIFEEFRRYHDRRYGAFSNLLRMTFEEARGYFEDGSVDLLHVDGRHFYEDVRSDFEHWKCKLSHRSVVLFHDTNVRERGFGVFRLWSELKEDFPSFEFLHGHGLGILAFGKTIPERLAPLFASSAGAGQHAIRAAYASLGAAVGERVRLRLQLDDAQAAISAKDAEILRRDRIQNQENLLAKAHAEVTQLRVALNQASVALNQASNELAGARSEIREIRSSTSWRLTAPLRSQVMQAIYRPLRRRISRRSREMQPPRHSASDDGSIEQGQTKTYPNLLDPAKGSGGIRIIFISGEPDTPGHHYRVERYAAAARAMGADVEILRAEELENTADVMMGAQLAIIWRAGWSDRVASVVELARKDGTIVIFDVDDLMIDPALAKQEIIDGIRTQDLEEEQVAEFYQGVLTTFAQADYGSAPTSFLAQYMRRYNKPIFVLPNGFDENTFHASRHAVRVRQSTAGDGLQRIGYAGGTRTHQRDFAQAAGAVARVLHERPDSRLVLFQYQGKPVVFPDEFAELSALKDRIEWRELVPLKDLPKELARFDVNLAPLEPDNPFCESKSELKYFEAALVGIPTIATPVEAFQHAIRDGVTGYLARNESEWYARITQLLDDDELRATMGRDALHDVLWRYGPERRIDIVSSLVEQTCARGPRAARAFELDLTRRSRERGPLPTIPAHQIVFQSDNLRSSEVTVVIPLFNYSNHIIEALESVRHQTLNGLDLIVIDDRSTDHSLDVSREWFERESSRFNRALLLRNDKNSGLALTRNVGFANAETPFVAPLDADNMLLPTFAEHCLTAIRKTGAAFVFPHIQEFGNRSGIIGRCEFDPVRFLGGNYIDAMSLVRKSAWAAVGGYDPIRFGWEDYDFWCKCVERGLWGVSLPRILAGYRVHDTSMLNTQTDIVENKLALIEDLEKRHSWIRLHRPIVEDGRSNCGPRHQPLEAMSPHRDDGSSQTVIHPVA